MQHRSSVPKDSNQLAQLVVEMSTKDETEKKLMSEAASIMGKLGGPKGGRARAKALSAKRCREIAQKAAEARLGKKKSR
jgi:hypothetical protein